MASKQVSEKEARQVAEAAREAEWKLPSFGKELFLGNFRLDLIHPPFWWWAWGIGLGAGDGLATAIVVGGYLIGRAFRNNQ